MFKAVIFDMDGVIIDSEPMHARASSIVFKNYNINLPAGYCNQFIGSTTYYMCKKICEDFKPEVSPDELYKANMSMKDHLLSREGHIPVPYVIDMIKNFYSNGLRLIIASSSPAEAIEEVMDALTIRQYFEGYVSGMQVKNPKPAPDIFLAAVRKLQLTPGECIVIEDSSNGVNAAFAAKIPCIGYMNPNSGNQDLRNATILVEGFEEINHTFLQDVYQLYQKESHEKPRIIAKTERMIIRELIPDDFASLFSLYHHPKIKDHIDNLQDGFSTEKEKLEAYIKNVYSYYGFGLWGVFNIASDKLIGICGIEYKSQDGTNAYELGYIIHPDYQGKGYALESIQCVLQYAFLELKIKDIFAVIGENNTKSINLAQKAGMVYEENCIRNNRNFLKYKISR